MSAPEPVPRAASSLPRWYAVERPCRPAPTTRYFARAGSTMSSLLPYRQCSFRDRHSVRRLRGAPARPSRAAAGRTARSATGSRRCRRRRRRPGHRPRRPPPRSAGAPLRRQDVDRAVRAEQAPEGRAARSAARGARRSRAARRSAGAPQASPASRCVARRQVVGVGDVEELDHGVVPGAVLGRRVPGGDRDASGAQHARDLVQRAVDVEPVECLPRAGDVGARRLQRQFLRRARRAPSRRAARAAARRAARRRARRRRACRRARRACA